MRERREDPVVALVSPHGYWISTVREGTLIDGSQELSKLQVDKARWKISHWLNEIYT